MESQPIGADACASRGRGRPEYSEYGEAGLVGPDLGDLRFATSRALDEADAAEDKQHARSTTVCFPSSIDDPLLTGSWPRLETGIATSDQVRKLSG